MKDWPFLFKPEMALATLNDTKTQTRRILTPRNTYFDCGPWPRWARENLSQWDWDNAIVDPGPNPTTNNGPYLLLPHKNKSIGTHSVYPKAKVGDRIWGREMWSPDYAVNGIKPSEIPSSCPIHYWADGDPMYGDWTKPKPSIFLPRWASRILCDVGGIGVERVQDISGNDSQAEGWPRCAEIFPTINTGSKARFWFKRLWNSINAKRGFDWDANPWVIVYKFKRIKS